ncbi:putative 2OG-Fe(II) oxygenase [Caulobacter sp. NIBR1757]|uniref:putative 2OG-Fe(II) oxygenase n=1 Tax=Caulobacter sp. NIBR1757 TaxID=3016000 RepID=UPI0022F06F21|nr:putative 2OG-Fe(II) oxygenase [Caulobacter sp. NIBR1757]WGM39283.1 Beta-barrel assembly-enhancing protease [Caulobacter sp. NIBR1757]
MSPDQARLMATVEHHLQNGRPHEAQDVLVRIAAAIPDEPRLWWAQATLAQMAGDKATVERALRKVGELDRKGPLAPMALGDFLYEEGRGEDAAAAWREAHNRDPRYTAATLSLGQYLVSTGDAAGAIAVLDRSLADGPDPSFLTVRASAHGLRGDTEAELKDYEAAVVASGTDPLSLQNLAMAQAAAGRRTEAEVTIRKAIERQPGSAGLHRTLGLYLLSRDAFDEAQAAFEAALTQDPDDPGTHRDLSQLIWTRTGDVAAAGARLDAALAGKTGNAAAPLLVVKGQLLEYTGDTEGAIASLVPAAEQPDAPNYLLCAASQVVLASDPIRAALLAAQAVSRAPMDTFGLATLAQAQLAAGDVNGAEVTAEKLRRIDPLDQHGIALQATAWRMKDDSRYASLADHASLVQAVVIETPAGWSSLEAFLADLAKALDAVHQAKAHPIGQTLRGGTQSKGRLDQSDDPVIQAFFKAIDAPIRAYIAGLGDGDDPMRGRPHSDGYRYTGSWSVRLAPGGRHVDHLHPGGWISSAFYVALPPSVRAEGNEGSLRFGHPGTPTKPPLEAEYRVKPQPGMLVLFPSFMWHGTELFGGDEPRLTIAFDVVPA